MTTEAKTITTSCTLMARSGAVHKQTGESKAGLCKGTPIVLIAFRVARWLLGIAALCGFRCPVPGCPLCR